MKTIEELTDELEHLKADYADLQKQYDAAIESRNKWMKANKRLEGKLANARLSVVAIELMLKQEKARKGQR